jgi:L-threonylcarbamoyladenylate synthase
VFDDQAHAMAEQHWPGPLTIVVPLREGAGVAGLVTAGLPTIALRVPAHAVMQALLRATGTPLAAPSANASGRISPTTAAHVLATLKGRVPLILDGGPTERGIESTIIAAVDGRLRLLRPGPVAIEGTQPITGGSIEAPGMMASHYAPTKPVRLSASERREGEWLIGFGLVAGDDTLSASGDLTEAAARLFACLHHADTQAVDVIAVAPIPVLGLGQAINDRLRRAAA